ncbi:vps16 [Candida theae]|uniref:Probable vacuolar protein sorting-associated protein 16 homolog n=1 Tax=Candida theae TaxID=1198502 RepID=A0AAD5BH44_9ASCO|nr:vps16 [Candida theae]KAI5961550.1 vps16 [Candida theae]
MPTNPTSNWSRLQNVYYDLRTCYAPLGWSIGNLHSDYKIAFASNSTLIAVASNSVPHPNLIEVYSLSGNKVTSVVYNSTPTDYIHDFCFRNEDLMLVLNDGRIRYYQDLVGNFNEYRFTENAIKLDNMTANGKAINGSATESSRMITNLENDEMEEVVNIQEVLVSKTHLVIRLDNKLVLTDLNSFQNYEIDISSFSSRGIEGMVINGSQETVIIYVACQKTILVLKVDFGLSSFELVDQELTDGPFNSISVSPNGQLTALHNKTYNKVFVVSSAFDQILLEYDTSNDSSSPHQVAWCGNDAIALSLKDEIKLIGPEQQSISFFYDINEDDDFDLDNLLLKDSGKNDLSYTIPIIQTLPDGLRVVTSEKVQFLYRVPEKTVAMYQIGSNSPSSILADCVNKFSSNAAKAHANITLLKSDDVLSIAMDDALAVALDELDTSWQKRALKAVSFGKVYAEGAFDADHYLTVLDTIKVLNQLRAPELGIFLSYSEVQSIGWKEVVKMLLRRNQHYLALRITKALELKDVIPLIYVHWCCYKIRKESNLSDVQLFKTIVNKLLSASKKRRNYISIDMISDVAHEEGRVILTNLLVDLEPSIISKIKKLVEFDETELALVKAFQSGDYALGLLMLLHLQDTLPTSDFFEILNQNESKHYNPTISRELQDLEVELPTEVIPIKGDVIGHTWIESLGKSDPKLMEKFLIHEDKNNELNLLKLKEFAKTHPNGEGEEYYNSYKKLLTKCLRRSARTTTMKAIERELKILELQHRLEKTYLTNFYSEKSLLSILARLIKMNQIKPASKIVREFAIPQEKFWHLVLSTYARAHEFDRLYEFVFGSLDASSGKSPIGFEPIIDAAFANNAPKEHISAYIRNSVKYKYDEKVRLFVRNGDYESAAHEAFKNKDIEVLRNLQQTVPNSDTKALQIIKSNMQKLGY